MRAKSIALLSLVTIAAAWLWAHEGHHALPTAGVSVNRAKGTIQLAPAARTALKAQTAEVRRQSVADYITAPAWIEAPWAQHAFATTPVPGKVQAIHVRPGQAVRKGEILAEMESLDLEGMQLEWLAGKNEMELSGKLLDQMRVAFEQGGLSERSLQEARSKHQENVNAVKIAGQKLLGLGIKPDFSNSKLNHYPIKSPIDGVVIHVDVKIGQGIEPAQHLFEIVDNARLWIRLGVLENDVERVQVGQEIELRSSTGELFKADIDLKGSYLDPQTHLATVWATIENANGKLLPGMVGFAKVFVTSNDQPLTVPPAAIAKQGAEHFVFVEEGPGQYRKQSVTIGRRSQNAIEVASTKLVPGDRVLTQGSHQLRGYFANETLTLSPEAAKGIGLLVEPARKRAIAESVEVHGLVDLPPSQHAVVSPRLPGTVHRIAVERNQLVEKGDVIAEVVSLDLQNLQLEMYRHHLNMKLLETTLDRLRQLAKGGAGQETVLRETEASHRAAQLRRDSIARKLADAGLSKEQLDGALHDERFVSTLPVRAPMDGRAVRFNVALGQAVKPDEAIVEIHDFSPVWVKGFVAERDLGQVQIGLPVRVRLAAAPAVVLEGEIVRHARMVAPDNRTLAVWIELKTPPPSFLQQNMLATITVIRGQSSETLAVPLTAIWREGSDAYVFIQQGESFERRRVKLGRSDDRFVEITDGIREGDSVAVHGVEGLQTAYASIE